MDVLIFYLKYASSMILGIEDGNSDDPNENDEVDDTLPAIAVIRHVHQMMMVRASIMESIEVANRRRRPALFDERLHWSTFSNKFGNRVEFKRHIRVSLSSFNKFMDLLRPAYWLTRTWQNSEVVRSAQKSVSMLVFGFWPEGLTRTSSFLQECQHHHCIGLFGNASMQSSNVSPWK